MRFVRSAAFFGLLAFAPLWAREARAQQTVPPQPTPGPNDRQGPSTNSQTVQGNGQITVPAPTTGQATGTLDANGQATGTTPPAGTPEPTRAPAVPADTTGTDLGANAGARAVGMLPPSYATGNFMDTRLTWTFGDDDFTHRTGQLVPLSQSFGVGDRQQYRLFFDNLNSRFAGRENITHLVMYKKLPAFIDRLTTEAALVLRFDLNQLSSNNGNLNSALYDSGSYLRLFYQTGASDKEGISAVFFPLDTDRFRLGYLYDISWGGTASSINQSIFPRIQGSSPGLKVQYDSKRFYAFAGFKTATIIQPEQILQPSQNGAQDIEVVRVGETNYGFLGGVGFDPLDNLRFDLGAGFFQQGKFDLEDVRGKSVSTYGGSGRIIFHQNMPVPQSVDFLLYKNDPYAPMILFKPERYEEGKVSYSVSFEGSVLKQHLKDFDNAGVLKNQTAVAAAVQGIIKAGYLRVSATGIARNLNFVVRNVPGFIPFETLPSGASSDPELFGALAADYNFPKLHLTPQVGGGVQMPATFRSDFTEGGVPGSRVIVVRSQGDESILPYNKNRTPIIQARVSVRWDISEMLGAVLWGQLVYDNNATLVVKDPVEGTASVRNFQDATRIGLGLALQARF